MKKDTLSKVGALLMMKPEEKATEEEAPTSEDDGGDSEEAIALDAAQGLIAALKGGDPAMVLTHFKHLSSIAPGLEERCMECGEREAECKCGGMGA